MLFPKKNPIQTPVKLTLPISWDIKIKVMFFRINEEKGNTLYYYICFTYYICLMVTFKKVSIHILRY